MVAAYAATLPPIPMHSGWVTFNNIEERDGFKTFRRYGYLGDGPTPLPTLVMFNCSKDVSKAASHLTFVLPKTFEPDSFPRSTWLPKIDVRFLIDDKLSVQMLGEYRGGELYIDLNTDSRDNFSKILLADTLAIGFGEKNDIIQFQFTEKVDGLFSEYIQKFGSGNLGQITHYARAGVGSVNDSCASYQQIDAGTSLASEEPFIILFSTVAALEVDCAFKTNRNKLNRLARMNGFKLVDFLPNGRFSEQMREQTFSMRGFIKEQRLQSSA